MATFLRRFFGEPAEKTVQSRVSEPSIYRGHETLEVVGESFYQEALWRIVGGLRRSRVRYEVVAVLEPDPTNPHDADAIKVVIAGQLVGHLSREDAAAYRPGLIRLIEACPAGCVGLHGAVVGGGERADGIGYLGVFLDHNPADFGLASHHERMVGSLRTGYSQARVTDLDDDRYDLSWGDSLSESDQTAIGQLHALLEDERDPIDRHYMFAELERRLYRCRQVAPAMLEEYDATCQQHHVEMTILRPALVEKFGVVPMIEMYRQATVRCQKSKDWATMLEWAERGISIYGDQAARPEDLADLQKRAAYAAAKLEDGHESGIAITSGSSLESLICQSCGRAFERPRARGRKPRFCPLCRS